MSTRTFEIVIMACSIFLLDSAALDANVDRINYVSEIDHEFSDHNFLGTLMNILKHEWMSKKHSSKDKQGNRIFSYRKDCHTIFGDKNLDFPVC